MTDNYIEVDEYLKTQYDEIGGYDFYRYIFPDNENAGEYCSDFSKPNAIYLYQDERDEGTKRRLRRRIMLNDVWNGDYLTCIERNPLTLCSGLSYRKRANTLNNAQKMHALIFDLDGVGGREVKNLFLRFGKAPDTLRSLPTPTFLVLSGKGLHVYYVFEEPIDLYPNIKVQLKSLKYDLTFKMWDYKSTSQIKQVQYQSINQSFRMVGSLNSKYGTVVKAYKVGEKVTIDYLNPYVNNKDNQVDVNKPFKPSQMTRAKAKETYPEWYARVVEGKQRNLKKWDIKSKQGYALYEWWKRQMEHIVGGHRYYFLMCMAIYACKCDVPKKQLKADMYAIFDRLANIEHENPLLKSDIKSALEAYDKEYYNFTIRDIEALSGVRIERNKRNNRRQRQHMEIMRAIQNVINPDWRQGNGRPSKRDIVMAYRQEHPKATKTDCKNDTGLTYPTIRKYWDDCDIIKNWVSVEQGQLKAKIISKELSDAFCEADGKGNDYENN